MSPVTEADRQRMASVDAHRVWAAPGAGCLQPNRNESWNALTPKLIPGSYSQKCKAAEYFSSYNIKEENEFYVYTSVQLYLLLLLLIS